MKLKAGFMFTYLLLCNTLSQNLVAQNNNVYYLAISMSQESRHGLAGPSDSGSDMKLQSWG